MKNVFVFFLIVICLFFCISGSLDVFSFLYSAKDVRKVVFDDPVLGWDFRGERDFLRFNELGVRSTKSKAELINSKKKKVILLGNSVVMAQHYPYSKTFSGVLQKEIDILNASAEIINAGFDGYEIYREFYKYSRDLKQINPDLVIWFPNRNDFVPKLELTRKIKETNEIHHFKGQELWAWIKTLRTIDGYAQGIYQWKSEIMDNLVFSSHNQYYTSGLLDPIPPSAASDLFSEILKFSEDLKNQKVKFVVVFLPSNSYVYYRYTWKDSRSMNQLKDFLDKNKISNFNFFPLFSQRQQFFIDYVHLNERGHQAVGKELIKTVIEALDQGV